MRTAAVDIGTNTVRCLIAETEEGTLEPKAIYRDIIRLGEGLQETGEIGVGALARLTSVLNSYREHMDEWGVQQARVVATSAMRDARNALDVKADLENVLDHRVDIINGGEEARLTALGVIAGVPSFRDGLVLDIGGGSTELIRVKGGCHAWEVSLPAGVVHLTEELFRDDPPDDAQVEVFRKRIRKLLARQEEDGGRQFAGTAGTPTTLAAVHLGIDDYDPTLINGQVLPRDAVEELSSRFLRMTSAERLELKGMEKGREDLIAAGTLIVLEVMDRWEYGEMIVSDWGLLEGIALHAAKGGMEGGIRKGE